MPQKIHWTAHANQRLRRLRSRGFTWETIAFALGMSRSAVLRHGLKIGARRPQPRRRQPEPANPRRLPLPAGHPLTWTLLTAGTLLAGAPYPFPAAAQERQGPREPAGCDQRKAA